MFCWKFMTHFHGYIGNGIYFPLKSEPALSLFRTLDLMDHGTERGGQSLNRSKNYIQYICFTTPALKFQYNETKLFHLSSTFANSQFINIVSFEAN